MAAKVFGAGDNIESHCTKCRTVTNHIIIAMTGNTPAKVECNTCGGHHKYRPVAAAKAPKAPKAQRAAAPKAPRQNPWLQREEEIRGANASAYDMNASYKIGAVIDHASFGLGLVIATPGPHKIEVLFESGSKIMRCK